MIIMCQFPEFMDVMTKMKRVIFPNFYRNCMDGLLLMWWLWNRSQTQN